MKNRGRWDGYLILTDGECGAPVPSRVKRGYVLSKGHKLMFDNRDLQVKLENEGGQKYNGAWR